MLQRQDLVTLVQNVKLTGQLKTKAAREASAGRSIKRCVIEPLRPDEVFYFAYGSNMNPAVLTGRRFVRPSESWPCQAPDYKLSFAVQGLPYAEPGFATIVHNPQQLQHNIHTRPAGNMRQQTDRPLNRSNQATQVTLQGEAVFDNQQQQYQAAGSSHVVPCVHGVLHRISQREWAYVKATEGVGSNSIGYQVITISCCLYDGETVVKAQTLQSAAASMHRSGRQVLPSQRYLQLLQEGAGYHKLDKHYQEWLVKLQPYKLNSLQKLLGTAASGAVLLTAAAPAVPAYFVSRAIGVPPGREAPCSAASQGLQITSMEADSLQEQAESSRSSDVSTNSNGQFKPFLSWYLNQAQSWTWFVHDTVLAPALGSGCSNGDNSQ